MAQDKKSSVTPRDLKLISIVGSLVIIVAFAWFGIKPAVQDYLANSALLESAQAELAQANNAEETQALQEDAAAKRASTAKLLKGYCSSMDSAQVDAIMTGVAQRYHAQILDLNMTMPTGYATAVTFGSLPTSEEEELQAEGGDTLPGIFETKVSVTFTGTSKQLQNVVDGLCSSYPGINIRSFQWEDGTRIYDTGNASLAMELSIYSYEG